MLELGLWRTLAETVKAWVRKAPSEEMRDEFAVWRASLLLALTDSAFFVAVKHRIHNPSLLSLYSAFRPVLYRSLRRGDIWNGAVTPG